MPDRQDEEADSEEMLELEDTDTSERDPMIQSPLSTHLSMLSYDVASVTKSSSNLRRSQDDTGSVSLIFACGAALFADGYANNVIGQVKTILSRIYGDELNAHNYSTTLTCVTFAGTVVGMLLFGWITDKYGRKAGMMSASGIVALFSALSAASGIGGSLEGLMAMLIVCRFLLGIGIGAEYPCGSVAASEQAEEKGIRKDTRQMWVALATNTMITCGSITAALVPLILVSLSPNILTLNTTWRLSLLLGAPPALIVFLWRLRMTEPRRYVEDSMARVKIPYGLVVRRYGRRLVGVSVVWFIFDFIVYPFGIFSSTIINNITGGTTSLASVFGWTVVIGLFNVPGTIVGAFLVDRMGPKNLMIYCLLIQAIVGFAICVFYESLTNHIWAFTSLYGLFQALGDAGPGNCTILLASYTSATAVRGQFYGVAAAVGKVGALVGVGVFGWVVDAFGGPSSISGNRAPFWIASVLVLVNTAVTVWFVEDLDSDLDLAVSENENVEEEEEDEGWRELVIGSGSSKSRMVREDREFREYSEANGFDTSLMGL